MLPGQVYLVAGRTRGHLRGIGGGEHLDSEKGPSLNSRHLSSFNTRHLSCFNSRHLSSPSRRHLACLNRVHLSCLNRKHLSSERTYPPHCTYVYMLAMPPPECTYCVYALYVYMSTSFLQQSSQVCGSLISYTQVGLPFLKCFPSAIILGPSPE